MAPKQCFFMAAISAVLFWGSPLPFAVAQDGAVHIQKTPTDCTRCHSCRLPTSKDPCLLNPCTRDRALNARALPPHGPDTVLLGQLEKDYLPVPFDHKGHARMGEMAEGCATCHHNTPKGTRPPKCESCHDPFSAGTDIHKPGLRGAFHQQCLGCHRDWSSETDCERCHLRKSGGSARINMTPASDDLMLRSHVRIAEPKGDFFGGDVANAKSSRVIFRHGQHVERFGFTCVECHHESNCSRCHVGSRDRTPARAVSHHTPCIRCHKPEMTVVARDSGSCERCHWSEGQPLPGPFDHAVTGWPLKSYHQERTCRDCHREVPFERPSRECRACHSGWSTSNFNHSRAGLVLDDNHKALDCAACHAGGLFDQPPTCKECHDEKAFPANLPGRRP